VIVFPPGPPVTVAYAGRPLSAYHAAYLAGGHVFAPIRPYLTQLADRLWYEGTTLVLARDGREVRIRLMPREPDALDTAYVPIAAIARGLGARVGYDAGRLEIDPCVLPAATPTPFDANAPSVAPSMVFTPAPVATPRPVFSGVPLPRRTPIPIAAPTPRDPDRRDRAR
jgi:hypothetical protein